ARVMTLAAERYPDVEAVGAGATRYTYARWSARINRLARGLARLRIGHGDHGVTLLRNREEQAALYSACQSLRAIVTPLHWRFWASEVEYCALDAEAVALVFEDASAVAALEARPALPDVRRWIAVDDVGDEECIAFASLAEGDDDPGPAPTAVESDVSIM